MKEYVTDVNVIFSALISGKPFYEKLFSENQFYTPDYALEELQFYQELILDKTKLAPDILQAFSLRLFKYITVVPNLLVSTHNFYKAHELCKDIDKKDLPYLALSLEVKATLLSNDLELVEGLREKGFKKVVSLKELIESL